MASKNYILICGGTACDSGGGVALTKALQSEIDTAGLTADVQIVRTGCHGFCEKGPIVKILPEGTFYVCVKPEDAKELVQEHLVKGRAVTRLLYDRAQSQSRVAIDGIDF